jgi:hypothetical protein
LSQAAPRVRGVVDIVFLLDVTGSMQPCIDAIRENIGVFVRTLSQKDANNSSPVKDWRARVVGYRDHPHNPADWIEQHPFVADAELLKAQLEGLQATGGDDEPESLLDALYVVATAPQSSRGVVDASMWRSRSDATRVVVVFTDASFHETLSIPEAKGGKLEDVTNALLSSRILLTQFAPDLACHHALAMLPKSNYECIAVPEGPDWSPQRALAEYVGAKDGFRKVMAQLAVSISQSADIPLADDPESLVGERP